MFWRRVIAGGGIKNSIVTSESKRWYQTIQAIPYENKGHSLAANKRSEGRTLSFVVTPASAVLQSFSTPTRDLTVDSKQIQSLIKNNPYFCSTVYNLEILAGNGSSVVLHSGPVLPIMFLQHFRNKAMRFPNERRLGRKKIRMQTKATLSMVHQKEEIGKVIHLVMVWDEGTKMEVKVPIVFEGINDCPGIKKGGYLQILRPCLKYIFPVEHIPPKIEVDLLKMDIGDQVLAEDVKVHPSLKLLGKNNKFAVCKILAPKPAESEPDNVHVLQKPKPLQKPK